MSEYELPAERPIGPAATDAASRAARQRSLGLSTVPDARFDALARKIVELTGAPAAMVNLVGEGRQYFVGLHVNPETAPGAPVFLGDPGREMDMEHGFCVHVVARRKALVLDDIYAYPRFAGNPVVDELGVRSYLGAPLIDDDGTVLGTVCAVDPAVRGNGEHTAWGNRGLEAIKAVADEVVAEIQGRQRISAVTAAAPGPVMVVSLPNLEVLHVNAAHEQLFGPVGELGAVATDAFPALEGVGLLAAIERLGRTGEPSVTSPVRLAAPDGTTALFAAVPARMPGQRSVVLTLGMLDADPAQCVAAASDLAGHIAGLSEPPAV
jgi:hypothetical protein